MDIIVCVVIPIYRFQEYSNMELKGVVGPLPGIIEAI
jgi:hypothetical protein